MAIASAALADAFRPWGVKLYLSVRWSAPIEIGGLKTADPLDPAVAAWWRAKADEIYRAIPDFGGFLVKANSEGQPGPQNYGRSHAEGANLLADALADATKGAEAGRDSTTPMLARKGRASYLGERSVGHQDPGATSSALLISAAATALG